MSTVDPNAELIAMVGGQALVDGVTWGLVQRDLVDPLRSCK